jgi:phosphatidate cytidylyltransferase
VDNVAPIQGSIGNPHGQLMEQLKRVTSAVVILPPLLFFFYYAPQNIFLILVLIVVALSLHEYFQMLALTQLPVHTKTSYMAGFLLVFTAYFGGERWMPMALFFGVTTLTVSTLLPSCQGSHRFPALLHSLFGVFFVGWGMSHLILLRSLPTGKWFIFFLFAIVWVGDSTAMYIGKSLGRHKMAPFISPGKTWEGALGGALGGVLAAVLGAHLLVLQLTLVQSLLLGFLVSLAAQVSDLGESMIKRYAGVKDSGELIPGHGGLLDRIDSVLFAAPMLLYALNFLLHT